MNNFQTQKILINNFKNKIFANKTLSEVIQFNKIY